MPNTQHAIGVFPLPICLLPNGVTRLRIFEQRYIRLVSEASRGDGFVMSLFDQSMPFNSSDYGVWVEIIDFETLSDGLLSIKVLAKSLVKLTEFSQDNDKLHRANMKTISHWSQQQTLMGYEQHVTADLAHALKKIFDNHQELTSYYPAPCYQDIAWVCARFIEILPLSFSKKHQLIFVQNFEQCQNFLHTVISGDQIVK